MAYQSLRNWYCMGPAGRLGAYKFAITRGFIFDSQAKYRRFWDVFVDRGDLRIIRAKPTHVFKEGDFRPVKGYGEEGIPKVSKDLRGIGQLPKALEKMSKTWLGSLKKAELLSICHHIGLVSPEIESYTNKDLIMLILNEKEARNSAPPLPVTDPKAVSGASSTQSDSREIEKLKAGGTWGI